MLESDSDEIIPEDIEIQRVDEVEIRNQKAYSKSRSSAQKGNNTAAAFPVNCYLDLVVNTHGLENQINNGSLILFFL